MSGYNEGPPVEEIRPQEPTIAGEPAYRLSGSFYAVTPSDTVQLPGRVRGLWIGAAGAVAVRGVNSPTAVTLLAVPAGTYIAGRFSYVMATNTGGGFTAGVIVAFCD